MPSASVQALEKCGAEKRSLEQREQKGQMGDTEEEVVRAFILVSTGEVKKEGSYCSDPLVDLLGVVGGKEAFFFQAYGEKKTV